MHKRFLPVSATSSNIYLQESNPPGGNLLLSFIVELVAQLHSISFKKEGYERLLEMRNPFRSCLPGVESIRKTRIQPLVALKKMRKKKTRFELRLIATPFSLRNATSNRQKEESFPHSGTPPDRLHFNSHNSWASLGHYGK